MCCSVFVLLYQNICKKQIFPRKKSKTKSMLKRRSSCFEILSFKRVKAYSASLGSSITSGAAGAVSAAGEGFAFGIAFAAPAPFISL